jgi:3-dehydroquinate synthase
MPTPEPATSPLLVNVTPPYPVHVGQGDSFLANAIAGLALPPLSQVVVVADTQVAEHGHADRVAAAWRARGLPCNTLLVPAGEDSKSVPMWAGLHERLLRLGADRSTLVCAVGGGVVGDLAGFVAATFMRGVPFVTVPTTLLAMVDAAVGGKTGIDLEAGKNLVGAFWQPLAVVADAGMLATLPQPHFREGTVELYKHALLANLPWRSEMHTRDGAVAWPAAWVGERQLTVLRDAIHVKASIVARDPLEAGERAHLNLGHTLAHALETITQHRMRHGTAVAYGLVYAAMVGAGNRPGTHAWLPDVVALARWAADAPLPHASFEALWTAMQRDKKRRGGRLSFVLLNEPGAPDTDTGIPERVFRGAWDALLAEFGGDA